MKPENPPEPSKSPDFERFEQLAKKLVRVPKREIDAKLPVRKGKRPAK